MQQHRAPIKGPVLLLILRPESGDEVVGVHDEVHDGVEEPAEGLVAPGQPPGHGEAEQRHDAVVDNL